MSTQSTSVQIFIESHSLIRERQFNTRSIERAAEILHLEHATGKMIINWSGGTIGSIQFTESSRINSSRDK